MDHIVEDVPFIVTTGKKVYEVSLRDIGDWQVKKYRTKEVRNLDSAKPFTLNRARLVGTVLKETSLVCASCFPVT